MRKSIFSLGFAAALSATCLGSPGSALADVVYTYSFDAGTQAIFPNGTLDLSGSFNYDVTSSTMVSSNVSLTSTANVFGNFVSAGTNFEGVTIQSATATDKFDFILVTPQAPNAPGHYPFSISTITEDISIEQEYTLLGAFVAEYQPTSVSGGVTVGSVAAPAPSPGSGLLSALLLGFAGLTLRAKTSWRRIRLRRHF
jgi:hypothetical protein